MRRSAPQASRNPSDKQPEYCICRSSDISRFMICCDSCEEWYHGKCIGVTAEESKLYDKYYCRMCSSMYNLEPTFKPEYQKNIPSKAPAPLVIEEEDVTSEEELEAMRKTISAEERKAILAKMEFVRCGRCSNCRREFDCEKCDFCLRKGGTIQQCRIRQCTGYLRKRRNRNDPKPTGSQGDETGSFSDSDNDQQSQDSMSTIGMTLI